MAEVRSAFGMTGIWEWHSLQHFDGALAMLCGREFEPTAVLSAPSAGDELGVSGVIPGRLVCSQKWTVAGRSAPAL